MNKAICFANAKIFFPEKVEMGSLYVKEGKIAAPFANPDLTIDCQGKNLCPGLIDLQVNGVEGIDFSLQVTSKPLTHYGVTYYLPTIVSQPLERYPELVHTCPVGIHLEGPYLNPERAGAHAKSHLQQKCDLDFWKPLFATSKIKMMTLAPEVAGALELIELAQEYGVVTACGHSNATFDELLEAKKRGLKLVTHLFNAMPNFHHRAPGVIGAVLGAKALPYSLIVDGEHLHQAAVRLAYNAFPEGLILISDCNALLGSSDTKATLGGVAIERKGSRAVLAGTDCLAGSCLSLLDAVRLLHKVTGCSLHEAIMSATARPASLVGLKKGKIAIGYDADLILFSDDLQLEATYLSS